MMTRDYREPYVVRQQIDEPPRIFSRLPLLAPLRAKPSPPSRSSVAGLVAYTFRKGSRRRRSLRVPDSQSLRPRARRSRHHRLLVYRYLGSVPSPDSATPLTKTPLNLYSVAVRVRLCQPTPELQKAEVENAKKWVDVAEKLGASHVRVFGGTVPAAPLSSKPSPGPSSLKPAADYSGSTAQ